jgi:Alginate lyase
MQASFKRTILVLAAAILPAIAAAQSPPADERPTGDSPIAAPLWLSQWDVLALQRDPARTASLRKRCDQEIDVAAQPVAVYKPPPHYTAQGSVETEPSRRFASDGNLAWRAALCYAASGDRRYARHAQSVISAWADTLVSVQTEQGASEINFDLPAYVLAASLVRGVGGWNDASLRQLLVKIALPLSHIARKNNHANWGVFLDATIAAYVGDADLLAMARARWLVLMDQQVAADGSLPLEVCRSDTNALCGGPHEGINGLSYTHYALLPTTAAARIFDMQGQAVWQTPQGRKLAAAYRRAAAWTLHPEQFPYYERNGGTLHGVRNAAYFALLQRVYPNDDAARLLDASNLGMNGLEWLAVFR